MQQEVPQPTIQSVEATGCQYCLLWQQQVQALQQQNAHQAVDLQSARMQIQALMQQLASQQTGLLTGQLGPASSAMDGQVLGLGGYGMGAMGGDRAATKGAGFFNAAAEDNPFHKTSMCKRFTSPAGCSFGDKCNFAHGAEELRAKPAGDVNAGAGAALKRQRPNYGAVL